MSLRFMVSAAVLGLALLAGGCAKYESSSVVDNNCSAQGGYYDPGYCSHYVAEVPAQK